MKNIFWFIFVFILAIRSSSQDSPAEIHFMIYWDRPNAKSRLMKR